MQKNTWIFLPTINKVWGGYCVIEKLSDQNKLNYKNVIYLYPNQKLRNETYCGKWFYKNRVGIG